MACQWAALGANPVTVLATHLVAPTRTSPTMNQPGASALLELPHQTCPSGEVHLHQVTHVCRGLLKVLHLSVFSLEPEFSPLRAPHPELLIWQ